ncbi:dihydrodipicolinate synthase family protein [Sulfitobacter sp. KE29]|uniref:dihydrodipicolinate synthase family protein n=1 Tax=unclassified Sulfitobacter TaxID=196795 RepID=UPI001ADCDF43|nr:MULTISPECIES: dihydrodipicolinate synthase family protein [unclassified Sulfitobacter]MBO9440395.1 dihydrodipicolinate synthase family protein [Sulfitobacter sp. R18_2]MDF3419632.1 dihydrodipicolinate synthase family protein [Sulfitobacter sp. Ks38]MDF3427115.1 dihydrodipicolinate synthase family protein [Sulfitobacter sp. KE29]MDF3430696.1 dihydrodipicolinate synthase family protein [Sulfitobacter sp. S46]MDF3445468.1 dihydrodipicolinate synthase family protein [Sulfitobacter sp. KE31]
MTKYSGIWPVAPTPFNDDGTVDYEGMKRVIDCMVDQGSDGICILANFSEQFLITDEERRLLTEVSLKHMAGRLPVIVTISHYATQIAVARAQHAKDHGAAMVMMMPPYHGALLKGSAEQSFEQFAQVGEVGIPIMVQDAPLSGVDLPVPLLVRMAREIEEVRLFKIECPQAATKLRDLIAAGGDAIEGPFDGEEAITLLADLEAGATGAMTSAMIPDQIKPVIDHFASGDLQAATDAYARILPAVNHENRQCGFRSAKAAMVEGGVIRSEFCRHPIAPLHPQTREALLRLIRPLEPVVLSWGK